MKTPQTTEDEEKEEAAAHLDSREHGAFAKSPQLIIEHALVRFKRYGCASTGIEGLKESLFNYARSIDESGSKLGCQ